MLGWGVIGVWNRVGYPSYACLEFATGSVMIGLTTVMRTTDPEARTGLFRTTLLRRKPARPNRAPDEQTARTTAFAGRR